MRWWQSFFVTSGEWGLTEPAQRAGRLDEVLTAVFRWNILAQDILTKSELSG